MLPRSSRISRGLFLGFLKKGTVLDSPSVMCRVFNTPQKQKFSVVVLKGVAKTAVDRNRIRRWGYGLIKKNIYLIPKNNSVIFFIKKKNGFKEFKKDFLALISRLSIPQKTGLAEKQKT